MHTVWIKSAKTKAEKDARISEIRSYKNAFDEAIEVLRKEFEDLPPPDYDSPSWAYKQADTLGANRMLQKVIDILNLKD